MDALEARKREGNALFQQKRFDEAVQVYGSVLDLLQDSGIASDAADRLDSAVRLNRAWARVQMPCNETTLAAAEEDCSAVIVKDPSCIKAFYRRALAREQRGLWQLAMEDAAAMKRLEPGNPSVGPLLERLQQCRQDEEDMSVKLHHLSINDKSQKDGGVATSSVDEADEAAAAWLALQADEMKFQKVYQTTTKPRRKPRVLKAKKVAWSDGPVKGEISEKTEDLWESLRREEATTVAKAFPRSKGKRPVAEA